MEIGRDSFFESTLRHLSGGVDFLWHTMPPRNRSGGMISGVNTIIFYIGAIGEGDSYSKFLLRNKSDGFVSHPVLEDKPNANHVHARIRNSRTQRLHNWTSSHNARNK
jgi:hypothetical protein